MQAVVDNADEIHALSDKGIKVLIDGLRWGTSYHGAGWNPRHIEGIDHFFFYSLEYETGHKFLHGQPVCLGVYIGALLHDSRAEEMLRTMHRVGLDIRPEAMGVTWQEVATGALQPAPLRAAQRPVALDRPRRRDQAGLRRPGPRRRRGRVRPVAAVRARAGPPERDTAAR